MGFFEKVERVTQHNTKRTYLGPRIQFEGLKIFKRLSLVRYTDDRTDKSICCSKRLLLSQISTNSEVSSCRTLFLQKFRSTAFRMCWRYLSLHACGHFEPTLFDTELNVQGRCDTVNAALVFYHQQPLYFPLQESLPLPRNCPPIFPGHLDTEQSVAAAYASQQYWNDLLIYVFESNGIGFEKRACFTLKAQNGKIPGPAHPVEPYPVTQAGVYAALLAYQNEAMKAPNVTVTGEVPSICQRCRTDASKKGFAVPPTSEFRHPPRFPPPNRASAPAPAPAPLSRAAAQPPPPPSYQSLIDAQIRGGYNTVREFPEIRVSGHPPVEERMNTVDLPSNSDTRSSSLPPARPTPHSESTQAAAVGDVARPSSSLASMQSNVPAARTTERAETPQAQAPVNTLEDEREEDEKHRDEEAALFDLGN